MVGVRSVALAPRTRVASVGVVAVGILLASVVDPGSTGAAGSTPSFDPPGPFGVDKWVHAGSYAALALVATYALAAWTDVTRWGTLLAVVAVVALYGVGIEVVQATIPARSFDLVDMAANATGALLAAAGWSLFAPRTAGASPGVSDSD
ncbi:VanZ family protein [Halomarina rubra]|uniref:VanZ family protein n=1 Tax=Halomarina rubra TaxID=2071873 RepID=A0ABD6AYM5_9EURY|nr:VanZ family protein [Halomarina rubra]